MASQRLARQVAPSTVVPILRDRTVTDIGSVAELAGALRDAEARTRRYARAVTWWAARFAGQVARARQAEARAARFEDALDHTCLRAIHAERELEAAEAAICRERTPIFAGKERLTIAERIVWLGDQRDATPLHHRSPPG
jgi:hypothetical protein